MTESFNRKLGRLAQNVSGTGTITSNAATASTWETARTLTLGGDLSGNVSIDGSQNVTLTATVAGNTVALGTDTTGDYVATVTAGTGITTTGTGEGAAVTVAIDNTVATLTGSQTLTNKTLTTPVISSISNTGALTLPTSTDTLIGRATTDTLTNKTISGADNTLSNIGNSSLSNSTISGISLGNNLADLTVGTGVALNSGTTYNGGTAKTISIGQAVGTGDNVTFAGVTADNIRVGVTGANEIDTSSGNLTIDSTGGTTLMDDDVNVTGNLQIDGNLTVSGTTVTMNATNLNVEDNMIYLNSGSAVANPDLGFAGNYNDGTYRHAGLFRDASDGVFKFFHEYTPEPDASAYIDITHGTFALAPLQASSFTGTLVGAAPAGSLSGSTLASGVTASSLTSVGTLTSLTVSGASTLQGYTWMKDAIEFGNRASVSSVSLYQTCNWATTSYIASRIKFDDSGYLRIGNSIAIPIANAPSTATYTDLVTIDSTGKVGIGTTNPSDNLDVFETGGSTNWRARIISRNDTGNRAAFLGVYNGVAGVFAHDNALANWATLYVNAVDVTSGTYGNVVIGGNVGIGTTSPATLLHILGADTAGSNATLRIASGNSAVVASEVLAKIEFASTDPSQFGTGVGADIRAIAETTFSGSGRPTALAFYTQPTGDPSSAPIAERVRIDSSGNVGIGTTNPGVKLDVRGQTQILTNSEYQLDVQSVNSSAGASIRRYSTSAYAYDVYQTSSHHWRAGILGSTAYTIYDYTNLTDRLTILTTGNVGIGTTNPANKLQIGSVGASGYAGNDLVIGNGTEVMAFYHYAGGPSTWFTNTNFALLRSGAGSTGSLGIGTSSPEARLDIIAAQQGTITTLGSEVPGLILQQRLTSDSNGDVGPMLEFRTTNGGDIWTHGAIATIAAGTYAGQMAFYTQPGGTTDTTGRRTKGASLVERMRIDESGNIGIGDVSPYAKLTVRGALRRARITAGTTASPAEEAGLIYDDTGVSSNRTGIYFFNAYSNVGNSWMSFKTTASETATERMRIDSSGNVGINTTGPTSTLSVRGSTNLGDSQESSLSSTHQTRISGYALRYDASNRYGNYGNIILHASNGWTSGARRFLISNGLGANKFAIIRSVDASTDPAFGDGGVISSGTADFVIDNAGNVGIGNTSPQYKLDVTGAGYFNSSAIIKSDNGANALYLLNRSADDYGFIIFRNTGNTDTSHAQIGAQRTGANAGNLIFYTGTTEKVRILDNGNVGIGTTNPTATLQVGSTNIGTFDGLAIGAAANRDIRVGQGSGNNIILGWKYNATAASAYAILETYAGSNALAIQGSGGNVGIGTTNPSSFKLQVAGNIGPNANGTYDLGSSSLRWSTVYTSDLSLSNGIGDWTIVEGEDDLFIYNNKNNKVYKFTLQEVDPSTAIPKKS